MDKASHLSVILDLSPTQWELSAQANNAHSLTLSSFISQLLAFLNAHMACKDENSLAVFGALPGKSVMLYSTTTPVDEKAVTADANTYRPFKILDSTITQNILEQIDSISDTDVEAPIDFVGALTKSLCYINRVTNPANSRSEDALILPDPRILIISVSPDQSSSYISVMNSIFSAQKLKVTIDVCKLHGADSVFLQQAAHLTGGSYISIERPDALLQFLMMSFLPPPSIRQLISVPTQDKIDFRAACFCHKNIVDIGFVCSVCLSIFCQPVPVCSTCQTKFPMKTLLRLKAAQPNAPHPPPSRATTPATPNNSLPRSTSIAPRGTPTSGAPRGAHASTSNGNANALPVARNTPRA